MPFAESLDEMTAAIGKIDFPCVVKPVMSSSGKGQSVLKSTTDIQQYSTQWPAAASITAV